MYVDCVPIGKSEFIEMNAKIVLGPRPPGNFFFTNWSSIRTYPVKTDMCETQLFKEFFENAVFVF